jgi:two-component system sensor histidine kinase PilS (NtrC family)
MFVAVSVAGFYELLPIPGGQRLLPHELDPIQLARMLGLNLAGIAGVGVLSVNLAGQLERASASLETQRVATADLITLHEDIVRSLPSGLITVDTAGKVLTINQAACAILHTDSNKAVGEDCENLMPGVMKLLSGPSIIARGEMTLDTKPNKTFLGVSVSPLFGANHERLGQVINFQDLTEVHELEQSIKQAERLAAVGSLAAGVAHEIRNPLASMSGAVELLSAGKPDDEESAALMGIVTREIERLNSLIRDFLDYTNPSPPKKVEIDLCDVVRDTVTMFQQDRDFEAVTVDSHLEETELLVESDPEKLRQVLWNLLRNAAEAANEGGRHVEASLKRRGRSVIIAVRDDGPGIGEGDLAKIFDPFFTTKSKGSGLGLATAHGIMRDLAGRLEVESKPGEGSTFIMVLPYTRAHEHVPSVRERPV